jgi:putative ABC transport system permease protein
VSRYLAYAREALDALWLNRARSILTMLGMIIGTSSVIAVLGIGNAASSGISSTLNSFGDPGYQVSVDPKVDDPAAAAIAYRDVATILEQDSDTVNDAFANYNRNYHILANGIDYIGAVTAQTDKTRDTLTMHEGRRIDADDVATNAHVAVITQGLERRFFGDNGQALGAIMRINGIRFRVIGVYDELKAGIFTTGGAADYVELSYVMFHEMEPGPVDNLVVYAQPGVSEAELTTALVRTLRHLHGPGADYQVQDVNAFLGAFEKTIALVGDGLTAIGGVALLVAGIGIMNIMLVSVTERTREIGIRKAIGGSSRDITTQFLMEALILSLIGGGTGMVLGILAVLLAYGAISTLLGPAPIPWLIIVSVAVGFSVFVGVVFGTYPAIRAGKLDPIAALRS